MDTTSQTWQQTCMQFVGGLLVGAMIGLIVSKGLTGIGWNRFDMEFGVSGPKLSVRKVVQNLNQGKKADIYNAEDPEAVAKQLKRRVKITCMVMLNQLDWYANRLSNIMESWGHRCTNISFIYTETSSAVEANAHELLQYWDAQLFKVNTADINEIPSSPYNEFNVAAFNYSYYLYPDTDWFLRISPDTFVILENLRYFLYTKDCAAPVVYGDLCNPGEISINGGIVFSREAFQRMLYGVQHGICSSEPRRFESFLRTCMHVTKTKVVQPLDKEKRHLFHSFPVMDYMEDQTNGTDWSKVYRGENVPGEVYPSQYAVTFWDQQRRMHAELNYFLYYFSLYGVYDSYSMDEHQ